MCCGVECKNGFCFFQVGTMLMTVDVGRSNSNDQVRCFCHFSLQSFIWSPQITFTFAVVYQMDQRGYHHRNFGDPEKLKLVCTIHGGFFMLCVIDFFQDFLFFNLFAGSSAQPRYIDRHPADREESTGLPWFPICFDVVPFFFNFCRILVVQDELSEAKTCRTHARPGTTRTLHVLRHCHQFRQRFQFHLQSSLKSDTIPTTSPNFCRTTSWNA